MTLTIHALIISLFLYPLCSFSCLSICHFRPVKPSHVCVHFSCFFPSPIISLSVLYCPSLPFVCHSFLLFITSSLFFSLHISVFILFHYIHYIKKFIVRHSHKSHLFILTRSNVSFFFYIINIFCFLPAHSLSTVLLLHIFLRVYVIFFIFQLHSSIFLNSSSSSSSFLTFSFFFSVISSFHSFFFFVPPP